MKSPMLIAMAGLPASGKSVIARQLAAALPAIILDKDAVRAALFTPADIDYSDEQNDLCLQIMFQVAAYLLNKNSGRYVILDGRTYSKSHHLQALKTAAQQMNVPLKIIECVCSDETARQRLAQDVAGQKHVAANRDFNLYQQLKGTADPIPPPKLRLPTDQYSLKTCTHLALDYLRVR